MALTPNMNLTLPDPSSTGGPLWAQELNTAIQGIDGHNHASGSGVQITPAGLNINADLTFQGNRALSLWVARFSSQSAVLTALTDKNQLYVVNGELYYQDGSGTNVQVTSSGSLNIAGIGDITGLSGTTAALTYSNLTKTFAFTQAANTAAKLDGGSVTIRDTAANANGITLQSPVGLGTSYALTLPTALPGTNYALKYTSTAGVEAYLGLGSANLPLKVNSSGTALQYATLDTAGITDAAITTAKLADTSVTVGKLAAANKVVVGFSGTSNSTTTNTSFVTGSITVTGNRPVLVMLASDGINDPASISLTGNNDEADGVIRFFGGTGTRAYYYKNQFGTAVATARTTSWPLSISFIDFPTSAGTYTATADLALGSTMPGGSSISVSAGQLIIMEL